MAQLLTTLEFRLEQLIIDLLKVNNAIIAAGATVGHIQDNDVQQPDDFVIVGVSSTTPAIPGLPGRYQADIEISIGTRVIGHDPDGAIRDDLTAAALSVIDAVTVGDHSSYGVAWDGQNDNGQSPGQNDTHILNNLKREVFYRSITIVTTTTTSTTTTTTTTTH